MENVPLMLPACVRSVLSRRVLVVLSSFYVQFLGNGFVFSFGVFIPVVEQRYGSTRGDTAWIGSLSMCGFYFSGPLASYLTSRYGHRKTTIIGSLLASSGLLVSIFAPNVYVLYIFFGVILGVGSGLMSTSGVMSITEFFPERSSSILGVVFLGASLGLSVFPIIVNIIMSLYGWQTAVGVFAALYGAGIICSPTMTNNGLKDGGFTGYNFGIIRHPGLIIYLIGGFLNNSAFFIPMFHMANYATSVGLSQEEATLILSAIGFSSFASRPLFGWLADRPYVNVNVLYGILPFLVGASILVMVYTRGFVMLMTITIVFGLFSMPYGPLAAPVLQKVVGFVNLSSAYGLWMFANGLGAVVGNPLSGWIFDETGSYEMSFVISAIIVAVSGVFLSAWPLMEHVRTLHTTKPRIGHVYVINVTPVVFPRGPSLDDFITTY